MAPGLGVLAARAVDFKAQAAGRAGEDAEVGFALGAAACFEAVVDDAGVCSLAVDGNAEVLHTNGQAFNAHKFGAADLRLHAAPAARYFVGINLGLGELFAHQRDADVGVCELQANVARAQESVQATAANEQQVDIDRDGGFVHRRGSGYIGHGDLAGFLLQAKAARHLHKAKDIQVQVARGAQQLALGCVQTQSQAAGLGCGAGANVECLRFVVHQRAVGGLAVDLDVQGVGADCQAVHPHKGGAGSTGREAGPAARQGARGFQAGELFARNGQAEFHAREAQARQAVFECAVGVEAAVQARIGIEIGAANGQHVHSNLAGRLGYRAVSCDLRIAQRDLFAALLQRQVALDTEEAKHVELKVAAHLQQFALGGIGRHSECLAIERDAHGMAARKICNTLLIGGGVVGQRQRVGGQGEIGNARQAGRAQGAGQALPLVEGIVCVREQAQHKLQPGRLQANKTALTGVQADSGGQTGTSHPDLVGAARAAIGQRQGGRLASPAHHQGARGLDKARQGQLGTDDRQLLCTRLHDAAKGVGLACRRDAGAAGICGGFIQTQGNRAGRNGNVVTQTGAERATGFKHAARGRDRQTQIGV